MCGIAGIVGSSKPHAEIAALLERMGNSLEHRGPDGRGYLLDASMGAGLEFRRLAIIDLETGQQPLSSEDGSTHAIVNGEIYNHRELRHGLECKGHSFRTRSDSEVVLHLYEEMGTASLPLLQGMFALAILDTRQRCLLLARDRSGMKPLYYAESKAGFLFASEIKAILAAGHQPEPDVCGIDRFLSAGFVPGPTTCFKGVKKFQAGHYGILKDGKFSCRPFWKLKFAPPASPLTESDYADELNRLLDSAVNSHLQADVPVGALISGGVDSSLVVSAATRLNAQRLKTFSIVFPDAPEADERPFQQAMVEHVGSDHSEVEFHWTDIPELAEKTVYHQDVPSLAFPSMVLYRLAGLVSGSVKTVLSGEGADEWFAGYAWHATPPYQALRRFLPPVFSYLPAQVLHHVKWGRLFRVLAARDEIQSIAEIHRVFTRRQKQELFKLDFPQGRNDLECLSVDSETEASCSTDLHRRMAVGISRILSDGLLTVNDRMYMAHGLEVRMPFLDHSLVDFAGCLPPDMARRDNQEKHILKLLGDQLPPCVAQRRKKPLSSPDQRYYRGPLRSWAKDVLLSGPPDGPLNQAAIEKQFDRYLDGSDYYFRRLRALIAFQLWWNLFFSNRPSLSR